MVYKKYIKRNGKTYGPYLYHNIKKDGRVTTHYMGKHKKGSPTPKKFVKHSPNSKKLSKEFLVLVSVLTILIIALIINLSFMIDLYPTGKVSIEVQDTYLPGEKITGIISLILKNGEFIPADSYFVVNNVGDVREYNLGTLLSEQSIEGDFYIEDQEFLGTGQGYGILGEKEVYPLVEFSFRVIDKPIDQELVGGGGGEGSGEEVVEPPVMGGNETGESGNETIEPEVNETIVPPVEPSNETEQEEPPAEEEPESPIEELPIEEPLTEEPPPEETSVEPESESELPSTEPESEPENEPVPESTPEPTASEPESAPESLPEPSPLTGEVIGEEIINAETSKEQIFTYSVGLDQTVEIISSDQPVSFEQQGNEISFTTDYFEIEQGFGEEYLTENLNYFQVDLSGLDLIAKDGEIIFSFVYDGIELTSSSRDINVVGEINETEQNITNVTLVNVTNMTEINVTVQNQTNVTINETFEIPSESFEQTIGENFIYTIGEKVKGELKQNLKLENWKETEFEIFYKFKQPFVKTNATGNETNTTKEVQAYEKRGDKFIWRGQAEEVHVSKSGDEISYDLVLNEKPEINVFEFEIKSKDLNFYYQPALNNEPDGEGQGLECTETECWDVKDPDTILVNRPENVVGSYAVYHSSKRGHKVGETNYKTGKAFHIYRPKIIDAQGKEVWGELNIEDERLTINVPQEFLDDAVYPVLVDPTFGYSTNPSSNQIVPTTALAIIEDNSLYSAQGGEIIKNYSIYMRTLGALQLNLTYYNVSGGNPQYRQESPQTLSFSGVVAEGWHTTNDFSSSPLVSGQTYIVALGEINNTANFRLYYDSVFPDSGRQLNTNLSLSPLWVPSGASTLIHGIYATYEIAGENNPPTHDDPIILPPYQTTNNLTCMNQSTYDADGDNVTNIYNWYANNASITILNLPFEKNDNSTAQDYSGSSRDFDVYNTAYWSNKGRVGGAYYLDNPYDVGDRGFLKRTFGKDLYYDKNFTLEAWINTTDTSGGIISRYCDNNHWSFRLYLSGAYIKFLSDDDSWVRTSLDFGAINSGTWRHVAVTYDHNYFRMYVDGQEVDSGPSTANVCTKVGDTFKDLCIGTDRHDCISNAAADSGYFNGYVDEVRIYNISLSANQIYQRYLDGKNGRSNASTIVSDEIEFNDLWKCEVTAHDTKNSSITKDVSVSIGGCRDLTENFTLEENVFSDGGCMVFAANDITLDCAGHKISYASSEAGIGIKNIGYNGTTIKNCILEQPEAISSSTGILLYNNVWNTTLFNNTILTRGGTSHGISLYDRIINTSIFFNDVKVLGASSDALQFTEFVNQSEVKHSNFTSNYPSISSSALCLMQYVTDNLFENTTFGGGGRIMDFYGYSGPPYWVPKTVHDNLFVDSKIVNGSAVNVYTYGDSHSNLFINSTVNASRINFGGSDLGNVTVAWYMDVNVTDSLGDPIESANVSLFDVFDKIAFTEMTNSSGKISRKNVTEAIYRSSSVPPYTTYYSNYTLEITKPEYKTYIEEINMTQSRKINVTFDIENFYNDCNAPATAKLIVNKTLVCEDMTMNIDKLNITSTGHLTLDNVFLSVGETVVENGGVLNINNSKNTIYQNGDLNINGQYRLDGSTLKMNGTGTNGTIGINVESGSYMYVSNNSLITNGDSEGYRYYFDVKSGSGFTIDNSTVEYAGWSGFAGNRGLEISSTNTFFNKSVFRNNYNGITLLSDGHELHNISAMNNGDNGIYVYGSDNNLINNSIIKGNENDGISFYVSGNNIINNSVVEDNGRHGIYYSGAGTGGSQVEFSRIVSNENYGIYLYYAGYIELAKNYFTDNSESTYFRGNANADVYSNIFNHSRGSATNLWNAGDSSSFKFFNNSVLNGDEDYAGIFLLNSHNAVFENNLIFQGFDWGFYLSSSDNTTIRNCNISKTKYGITSRNDLGQEMINNVFDSFISETLTHDVFFITNSAYDNILNFVNVSFEKSKVNFDFSCAGTNGDCILDVGWYFDSKVENSLGVPLSGINVTSWNNQSEVVFSEFTSFGRIPTQIVSEYVENRTHVTNYNNHSIQATSVNFPTYFGEFNLTTNLFYNITLNTPPGFLEIELSSSSGQNYSSDNLSVTYTTLDLDSDDVTVVTNWLLNGSSITRLNMPFDLPSDGLEAIVKDYSSFGNDGVIGEGEKGPVGPVWTSDGIVGGAYEFDGTNDVINCGDDSSLELLDCFSVEVWIRPNMTHELDIPNNNFGVMAKALSTVDSPWSWQLRFGGADSETCDTDTLGFQFNLDDHLDHSIWVNVGENLTPSQWYHVLGTYNDSHVRIYLNGELKQEKSLSTLWNSKTPILIGNEGWPGNYFNGTIDEVRIYNRSLSPEQIAVNYQAGLAGHAVETIVSQETSFMDWWRVSLTPIDGFSEGTTELSNIVNLSNTLPTVTLISPEDNNITTNRTPLFTWSGYDDAGRDMIYQLNLTCFPACSIDNRLIDVDAEAYTLENYLKYLKDNNFYYLWSVRASNNNGVTWGPWADPWKIEISSLISIEFVENRDTVNFGLLQYDGHADTLSNDYPPFLLENDGNCFVNVTMNATNLWRSVANPSDYFKYKIDDNPLESGAFDSFQSQIYWAQVQNSSIPEIVSFNFSDDRDSAEIDIYVEVPGAVEGAGPRSSILTFTARLGESGERIVGPLV